MPKNSDVVITDADLYALGWTSGYRNDPLPGYLTSEQIAACRKGYSQDARKARE